MNIDQRDELLKKFDSSFSRDLRDATQWLIAVKNDTELMVFSASLGKYLSLVKGLKVFPELEESLKKFEDLVYKYVENKGNTFTSKDSILDIVEKIVFFINILRQGGAITSIANEIVSDINKF